VPEKSLSRLALSLFLTLAFVIVESVAGIFANSLALLTDAAHNLTDVIALGFSWFAMRLTGQPSNARKTYGYHRAGILVALINSTTLVLIALGIFYEAWRRFMNPPQVNSPVLIAIGLLAVGVNLYTAWLVRRGSRDDLNLRAAYVHLVGDVLSTAAAVVAGVVILFTGQNWLDPLVSVLIGFLIVYNAWGIVRETVDILLESTPRDVDMPSMVENIMQIEGVLGVHDLHVWSLTKNLRAMSAHVLTEDVPISRGAALQRRINDLVYHRYNITHATLQLECESCEPDSLYHDMHRDGRRLPRALSPGG